MTSGRSRSSSSHAGGEHELGQLRAVDRRHAACRPAPARRRCRSRPRVAWSAFSAEKQMPRIRWPSSARSLSLAVTTATFAPASAKRGEDGAGAQVLRVVHHHFRRRVSGRRSSCRRCRAPTGGAPVTIDRLFGLVKLGTTQSATQARAARAAASPATARTPARSPGRCSRARSRRRRRRRADDPSSGTCAR